MYVCGTIGCYSEYFIVIATIGVDPTAIDYDPYVVIAIEECLYPCLRETYLILDMNPWDDWQLDGSQTWEALLIVWDVVLRVVSKIMTMVGVLL